MVWAIGQQLYGNRYIIERQLGKGGIGITYLAKTRDDRQVVIKTLLDKWISHPQSSQFREKFRDEALLLSLCKHPNIVQVDNYFNEGDFPCMVMEYVQGEDLWEYLKNGVLSEMKALSYIRQIGEALILVHNKGLLHRDIKPQNIMICPSLNQESFDTKLIDFGLARGFVPDEVQHLTFGLTHGFAPPEQYVEIGNFAEFTDVYALAATLYYLLTKTMPTPAFQRALNQPLPAPKLINSSISDRVNEAIIKGMEMNTKYRPQSVRDWLTMLPVVSPAVSSRVLPSVPIINPVVITAPVPSSIANTVTIFTPTPQPAPVVSVLGVKYLTIDNLLASGQWQEADEETANQMLTLVGREKEGWLRVEDINNFPDEDWQIIDKMWLKYSNERFGFSVQKRIYESLGGTQDYHRKVWDLFGDRVGWRVNKKWLRYDGIKFVSTAPIGHLPAWGWGWLLWGLVDVPLTSRADFLLSRRDL
ncbi:serine/threonine protein kinase [Oscillatoriales cyanobacterium USR001]|nr:serine/threonine protein kinase [Oscillatoriales cyanobacterium USR001]